MNEAFFARNVSMADSGWSGRHVGTRHRVWILRPLRRGWESRLLALWCSLTRYIPSTRAACFAGAMTP
jgi:hypothetical protein